MKKNRFALILIIVLCAFTLCGCATVSYTAIESEYGGISQIVEVDLNKQQLISAGMTQTQFQNMVTHTASIMQNKQSELMANYQLRVNSNVALSEGQKEVLKSGVETKIETGETTCKFTINFSNISCYYYFYDIDPKENDGQDITTKNDGLFFKTQTQTSKTIFSNTELVSSYQTVANNYLNGLGLSQPQKITQPTFSYSYKTSNRKLRSDADKKESTSNGSVIHTWTMTSDQAQKEIHFYTLVPRRAVWYGFALGGAFVIAGALLAYNAYKSKKKKHNDVEIVEP